MLNFPVRFINWIMECVTSTSFSTALNGNMYGHFVGRHVLRQGDPLSPFLFALCLEALSRSLKCISRSTAFGFHPKCRNLLITHLAYADDLLLFSRGDVQSFSLIMNCLNRFGDMAGLRINLNKSNVYLAIVDDCVRQAILNFTGFACGVIPFLYLGIPLASTKLKTLDYSLMIDAIRAKIFAWPQQTLSYAGKVELI